MFRATSPRVLLAAMLALCLVPALPAASQAQGCANANVAPEAANVKLVRTALLCLHNRERAARGLPKLREQTELRAAARSHSVHMVDARFFAHDDPGGES